MVSSAARRDFRGTTGSWILARLAARCVRSVPSRPSHGSCRRCTQAAAKWASYCPYTCICFRGGLSAAEGLDMPMRSAEMAAALGRSPAFAATAAMIFGALDHAHRCATDSKRGVRARSTWLQPRRIARGSGGVVPSVSWAHHRPPVAALPLLAATTPASRAAVVVAGCRAALRNRLWCSVGALLRHPLG